MYRVITRLNMAQNSIVYSIQKKNFWGWKEIEYIYGKESALDMFERLKENHQLVATFKPEIIAQGE